MTVVDVHAAGAELSALIDRACAGEEIVVALDSGERVRLVPVAHTPGSREFGILRGRPAIPDAFFDPLPREELDRWEG